MKDKYNFSSDVHGAARAARDKLERKAARGPGFSDYAKRKLEVLKDEDKAINRLEVPTKDELKDIENPGEVRFAFVKDTNTMYVYTGVGEGVGEVSGWSEVVIGHAPTDATHEQLFETYRTRISASHPVSDES